ncbi:hypothetical protein DVZ84_31660 [Streptomyces parvulus]|uniref:Uncharacterized protein n=1 Tax=Streptomyces parvulus TaxID=146923 RepID=A0A369UWF1_9ACTN|nr:hypothetical protein DVZ84_31660 [Streptomyces parvulus]
MWRHGEVPQSQVRVISSGPGWTGTLPVWSGLVRHSGSLPVRRAWWWPQVGAAACQVVIWSSVRMGRVMVGWAGVVWCRSVAVALTWPGVRVRWVRPPADRSLWPASQRASSLMVARRRVSQVWAQVFEVIAVLPGRSGR